MFLAFGQIELVKALWEVHDCWVFGGLKIWDAGGDDDSATGGKCQEIRE